DKSTDDTKKNIKILKKEIKNKYQIIQYDGPGICKSKNVYKGIDLATGDIIIIYDADLTVKFDEIMNCINLLNESNIDFINCTRMIYPQKYKAMKTLNFFGNIFFAKLFSILFRQKITDTLCGTKIFYRNDWQKIKKFNSRWGAIDKWGDFDLLIGAYQNNLKISEIPIHYQERVAGSTKMNSLILNTIRMLFIVLVAYYKLKIRK
ncbi:glycosyltransferase, partial [Candidatus Pelagibacter sp.]|nr:glycosyltransferase [Candidatus Pelagibacter sp.]